MSQLTKKYLPIVKRINKLADKNKKGYVRKCNDCLSECATNVLRGNVPLSSRQGAKVKRNKKDLRLLSAKKTSLRKKRHIVQKGGFLGALPHPYCPCWVDSSVMQYAKKLGLVDPKILHQLRVNREYKAIQRPAPAVANMSLSLDISLILNDETISDDEKVKLYGNALRRYVNIRHEIPAALLTKRRRDRYHHSLILRYQHHRRRNSI